MELRVVEEVFARVAPIWHLHVGGQVIATTAEHPFYAFEKGWIATQDLVPGDHLLTADGSWSRVDDLLDTQEWLPVFNLRIADFHTYFVGCDDWWFSVWAHNMCSEADVLAALTKEGVDPAHLNLNQTQWIAAYANLGEAPLLRVALDHYMPQGKSPAKLLAIQQHLEAAAGLPLSRDLPQIPVTARTGGGIEFGDPAHPRNSTYFESMRGVAPHENFYDVVAHGMPDRLGSFEHLPVTAAEFAQIVRGSPGYSPGQPVRLLSCWSAAFDHGFAGVLARELGTHVIGGNSQIFSSAGSLKLTTPRGPLGQQVGTPRFKLYDASGAVIREFS